MALDPLATVADLAARGVDTTDTARVEALLDAASESIRAAAGSTISAVTATVTVPGCPGAWLWLPGFAPRGVSDVSVDTDAVSDWRLVSGRLWRAYGWQSDCGPANVTLTYTQGLDEVPADIVDLCCSLVAAGMAAAAEGYDPRRSMAYERIDDYQYGLRQGDDEVVSPMDLPPRVRASLASRFGTGVSVTGVF